MISYSILDNKEIHKCIFMVCQGSSKFGMGLRILVLKIGLKYPCAESVVVVLTNLLDANYFIVQTCVKCALYYIVTLDES